MLTAMLTLADVVRRHGPAYVARFGGAILPRHVRALDDIVRCRTPALGGHLAVCTHCNEERVLFHSCRNRACPRCGHDTTARWLERQRQLLLPVPYFHVVFTLPDELRRLVRSHQRALVGALFRAAEGAVAALARDDRFLGAQIGALAGLHTWTRTLEWHPHVHMLVPAGGLAPDGRTWRPLPRRAVREDARATAANHAESIIFLIGHVVDRRVHGRFRELVERPLRDEQVSVAVTVELLEEDGPALGFPTRRTSRARDTAISASFGSSIKAIPTGSSTLSIPDGAPSCSLAATRSGTTASTSGWCPSPTTSTQGT